MLHHSPEPGVDCQLADSRRWWQAWSAPELRIVISHDVVEVFQFRRPGWPGRGMPLLHHQRYPLADEGDVSAGMPGDGLWQTLRSLLAPLVEKRWHVVVVFSNRYSRWLVLPWQAEIRSRDDWQAYFQHGLQQAFGTLVADWHISYQSAGVGRSFLLNAMPAALVSQLHTVCNEFRLPPGMVLPAWQLSANQALSHMQRQGGSLDGWVICRESDCLTVACLHAGEWQQIRMLSVDAHWARTLQQYLQREQVLHPAYTQLPVYLTLAESGSMGREAWLPFTLVDLQPAPPLAIPTQRASWQGVS